MRIRRFRWQDLERLTYLFNEVNGISGTERAYDVEIMREELSDPSRKPEQDCLLAESDSSFVGFALIVRELAIGRAVVNGGVLKSHRNLGIGRELTRGAVEHAQALNADVVNVEAASDRADARHLLVSEGFRPVKTYWEMRWETSDIPPAVTPKRFSLRPFVMGQDEVALTELQNAVFAESWGFCPNTVEDISAKVRSKRCQAGGIIFVVDGNRPTAYNWTMSVSDNKPSIGWIAMTGVHPDYRREGLGKAVVVAGMRYLKTEGVNEIELQVDSENRPARTLYLELGFKKLRELVWYERRLRP